MNSLNRCRILWSFLHPTNSVGNLRNFSSNRILRQSVENAPGEKSSHSSEPIMKSFHHKVSNFDKKILVWTKKFPNTEAVPKYVADDIMQNAMSKARVRICNIMIVCVVGICIYTVFSSKKLKEEYVATLEHTRDDYRRQITEEFRQKMTEEEKSK